MNTYCTSTLVEKNGTVKAESSETFQIYLMLSPIYSLPGIVPYLLSSIDMNSAIYNKGKLVFIWLCRFDSFLSGNPLERMSFHISQQTGYRWGQSTAKAAPFPGEAENLI